MNVVQNIDAGLNSILNDYVRKPTLIRAVVHLMLILYAARLAPTPPKIVLQLFDNVYFKLCIFSLVLWTAQFSPSTSILIALAFMVTVNYTTTGKLWEMMDNIGVVAQPPASISTAIDAIKVLSEAAVSPIASSPTVIAPIANIAVSASTTQEGIMAIKALAEQAVTPEAGTVQNVQHAAGTAIDSIMVDTPSPPAPVVPVVPVVENKPVVVTVSQGVQAVHALAEAAISDKPVPVENVQSVAEIALSVTTTEEGADAIKALAQQAVTAESGVASKVNIAVQTAIASIKVEEPVKSVPTEQQSGCYPMRNYDMTKVSALDGKSAFEDYQTFTSTTQ